MALYQLNQFGSLFGNTTLNRYYFEQKASAGTAPDLLKAFQDTVAVEMIDLLSDEWFANKVECFNLDDPTDFQVVESSLQGLDTGVCNPAFMVYAFRLNRSSRQTRNGRKSYSGVVESNVDANGELTSAAQTKADAVAAAIGSPVFNPVGLNVGYDPVLILGDPTNPLNREAYDIASASFVRISTQNSRKDYSGR